MSEPSVPLPTKSKPKRIETYQPTYQLVSHNKFNNEKVEKILQQIFKEEFEPSSEDDGDMVYNEKQIPELCFTLSEKIRNAIKEEGFNRYRLLVIVTIGQKRLQGFTMFHSFLWDPERDTYVTHSFENLHLFAHVVVYGVYLD